MRAIAEKPAPLEVFVIQKPKNGTAKETTRFVKDSRRIMKQMNNPVKPVLRCKRGAK